ncbi:pyridoxamine 5'-phosphate oxidase family protein [Deinococcus soli (ex Cha et al. 2016)]|uniref:pyridoxamine 5'-phosphate oxidase family protein n=1 Tax=Deinococcus soli (ex Cha et al. 2016) TaxID=1309411 RepID=UPI00166D1FD8|nr:pyridoxamine 5'-phosphate oxidase family protein [Deinococcus soli (ex Cha et al. 2016)]
MTQQTSTHPTSENIKKLSDLIKGVKFAMLTVQTAEGHLHAHPMTTQEVEFDGDIWFIGGKDTEQVAAMRAHPQVNVSYARPDKGVYVSVNGEANLVEDRAKLDELWSDMYKAYFPQGKEDPNIQLIHIAANGAEYWESDGKVRSLIQIARGLVTGEHAHQGENETVKL